MEVFFTRDLKYSGTRLENESGAKKKTFRNSSKGLSSIVTESFLYQHYLVDFF